MSDNRIAMFELRIQDKQVKVIEEKHYQLVSSGDISLEDLHNRVEWLNNLRAREDLNL